MDQPNNKKKKDAMPRSRMNRLHGRLVSMCVVETTAASYSGKRSWKTEPCRILLRMLTRPDPRT
jgi:hypothetical protein